MEDSEEEQQELGNKMLGTQSLNGSLNDNPAPIASIASFAQTLTQALKSTDTKLLESCFLQQSKNNKNLISNTIQRLPRKLLHTLIEQIVICLNRKKRGYGDGVTVATVRRTKTLIEWVRQILLIHMSYLLTIPTLVTQLTTLHASLQKRLNLHTKLLSLNGRLELVLNQIELSKLSNRDSQSTGIKTIKAIDKAKKKAVSAPKQEPYRYVEGESSASEEEGDNSEDDSDDSSDQSEDEADGDSDEAGQTDSDEEGSVEDVVLGSGSDEEDSGDNESEAEDGTSRIKKLTNGINDLLDLEAEESESEGGGGDDDDDDDEEEEEEEDDDDDDSMEGFIDDGSEGGSEEEGSD